MTGDRSEGGVGARGAPGSPATLVITGMHRSGTSLLASAFQLAGVHVGDHLDGPSQGNQRGHFEDIEFQRFHDRVLERAGKNFLTVIQADALETTPDDVERAKALIDRRRSRPLWGWKDPRTSLFLDFWHPLLGNPRYVFVYRHPLEVVLSLFRRGWYLEEVENPLVALEAWCQHNQAILDFYRRYREWCLLGHVRAMAGDLVGTVSLCARRLGLDLVSESASAIYQPSELTQRVMSGDVLAEFARIAPSAAVLYHRLEQAADLPDANDIRPVGPTALVGASLDARRDAGTLRRDFELLLAQLEPRTFVGGKESLDGLRKRELESLGAQCRHLAAELAAHQAHLADLRAQNGALQARMAELATQNTGLQSEVMAGERSRAELESRLVESESRQAEAERRLVEAQSGLDEAQSQSIPTTMRAKLEAENAARRAGEARLDADVAELRRSLEQTQRSLCALKEQAATDLSELARTIQRGAEAESSALANAVAQAEARSAAAEGRSIAMEAHLAAIGRTRAWRAAQKWYAIKRAAARMLPF